MAKMVITQKNGTEFIIIFDEQDRALLKSRSWCININHGGRGKPLACGMFKDDNNKFIMKQLRRLIMNEPEGLCIIHLNHNTLDYRRKNLRAVTRSVATRFSSVNKGISRYRGVSFCKHTTKHPKKTYYKEYWRACITTNDGQVITKYCKNEYAAALVHDQLAKLHHGELAVLNFP